jgi:hypothetical protein
VLKDRVDTAKSVFELSKQVLIAGVLAFLIFKPDVIGTALDKMGITEGDIWGLKWKKEFKRTDEALQTSQGAAIDLTKQVKDAQDAITEQVAALEAVQRGQANPAQVTKAVEAGKKVLAQGKQTIATTQQSTEAIQQAIAQNTQLIARVEAESGAAPGWVILTGSDPTVDAAQAELRRAKSAGYNTARIFHSRNVYRTGIPFADRSTAMAALDAVRSKTRQDAYPMALDKFCPLFKNQPGDVFECGN